MYIKGRSSSRLAKGPYSKVKKYPRIAKALAGIVAGRNRTVGFYGRYNRPGKANSELKFFDTGVGFSVDSTAEVPATGQLCLIPQGAGQSERIGRKVMVKSIHFHGYVITSTTTALAQAAIATMYVVLDQQCNGTAATAVNADTGVFVDPPTGGLSTAMLNLANGDRFRILKKITIPLNIQNTITNTTPNTVAGTSVSSLCYPIEFNKKVNIPIEYDAALTTGALTTIRSNNIFLVAGSSGTWDDVAQITGTFRLRYSD